MRCFLLLVIVLLTACNSITPIRNSNGDLNYAIECRRDNLECLKIAGKICDTSGYYVFASEESHEGTWSGSMMIQCKQVTNR
jgi:hypothetical protein